MNKRGEIPIIESWGAFIILYGMCAFAIWGGSSIMDIAIPLTQKLIYSAFLLPVVYYITYYLENK